MQTRLSFPKKIIALLRGNGYIQKEIDEFLSQSDINDFAGDSLNPKCLLEEMRAMFRPGEDDFRYEGPNPPKETGSPVSMELGHIDLGLSVKWGTCNLGASKPEEYGEYYAWGETRTKKSYEKKNYKFGENPPFTKYQPTMRVLEKHLFRADKFKIAGDSKSVLDEEDDIVRKELGGSWRIPSSKEFNELLTRCEWTWVRVNGISGYKVQPLKPGYKDRWIFLPASGFKIDKGVAACTKKDAAYWTSSCDPKAPGYAFTLSFPSTGSESDWDRDIRPCEIRRSIRYSGHTIRPICD